MACEIAAQRLRDQLVPPAIDVAHPPQMAGKRAVIDEARQRTLGKQRGVPIRQMFRLVNRRFRDGGVTTKPSRSAGSIVFENDPT